MRNPREDPPLSFLMETHQISAFDFDKKDEIKPPQPRENLNFNQIQHVCNL